MADLNRVFLMGRLTHDPELRYTPNGSAVADLRLATSRVYNTKDGERREDKLFIDVTVWNRQAENCCQYLKKGRPVHVEGYLKMDSWDDKTTGEKRSKIKVEADRVQFLDSRRDDEGGGGGSTPGREDDDFAPPTPPPAAARRSANPAETRGTGNGSGAGAGESRPAAPGASPPRRSAPPETDVDDDIPF